MAKLGLKDKAISELEQKISSLQTQLAESERNRASITQRCEELTILVQALMQTDNKVGETSSVKTATKAMSEIIFNKEVPDEICQAMATSLEENDIIKCTLLYISTLEDERKELKKKLNYLSLSQTKKSERVKKDDQKHEVTEKDGIKYKIAKTPDYAAIRGEGHMNNDVHRNVHSELPIDENESQPPKIDTSKYQIIGERQRPIVTYIKGYYRRRIEYSYTLKEISTGKIIRMKSGEPTPLVGSSRDCSLDAHILHSKFCNHESVCLMSQQMMYDGLYMAESTINGAINKYGRSNFFRNMDMALYFRLCEAIYFYMDETKADSRTTIAKEDAEFIKEFWIWNMYSVDFKLVRFSADNGSRSDSVAYELVKGISNQCVIQTDAKSCYINFMSDEYPNIVRIACLQHARRPLLKLEDPRAKELVDLVNQVYHLDNERKELAAKSEKKWTTENHLQWRKIHITPVLDKLETRLQHYQNDPLTLPKSEFLKAVNHLSKEMDAIRAIFNQKMVCTLDSNMIERSNRTMSYFRKISQAFGSIDAAENQCIFFSLVESCKLHNVNPEEYFKYLLKIMPTAPPGLIKSRDDKACEFFLNILPDMYAKTHKTEIPYYPLPDPPNGPLNAGAKRKGYKKRQLIEAND